jgi:triosephosphate isomerase
MRFVYGSQDISAHDSGAYTGEISGVMLAKLGCTYAIVGHSERRQYHAEDDALCNAKVRAAFKHGLRPILCIGEALDVRQGGAHVPHCLSQLDGALEGIAAKDVAEIVIAYEPVWAIGTGEVATAEDAQEVCGAVRSRLAELYSKELADGVRVLYGGSVKGDNIAGIMAQPDVDGALVGGASLQAEEFVKIIRYQREKS